MTTPEKHELSKKQSAFELAKSIFDRLYQLSDPPSDTNTGHLPPTVTNDMLTHIMPDTGPLLKIPDAFKKLNINLTEKIYLFGADVFSEQTGQEITVSIFGAKNTPFGSPEDENGYDSSSAGLVITVTKKDARLTFFTGDLQDPNSTENLNKQTINDYLKSQHEDRIKYIRHLLIHLSEVLQGEH